MRPRAVLFDWDKTLVDNWGVIRDALNAALVHFGHPPWSEAEVHARVKRSLRDSFPELFGDAWRAAELVFREHFNSRHLAGLRVLPGAGELLARLAGAGVTLAVVSNKHGGTLRLEAEYLGWTGYFHRVVGAADAPADKPSPLVVQLALEGSGLTPDPQTVWFVGDSAIDLECAHRAGCLPVLLGSGPADPAFPPALSFADCRALGQSLISS